MPEAERCHGNALLPRMSFPRPNISLFGGHPLVVQASDYDAPAVVQALLQVGALVNATASTGDTALKLAHGSCQGGQTFGGSRCERELAGQGKVRRSDGSQLPWPA
eukprot:m.203029 g.203029  ORF g.203029 m.203029 type:complete len:106 (+) comp25994_c2_seq5:47-364(+)